MCTREHIINCNQKRIIKTSNIPACSLPLCWCYGLLLRFEMTHQQTTLSIGNSCANIHLAQSGGINTNSMNPYSYTVLQSMFLIYTRHSCKPTPLVSGVVYVVPFLSRESEKQLHPHTIIPDNALCYLLSEFLMPKPVHAHYAEGVTISKTESVLSNIPCLYVALFLFSCINTEFLGYSLPDQVGCHKCASISQHNSYSYH